VYTLEVFARANLRGVRADRSQLKQVILNLAANARDAMPRGGRLSIALAEVAADGVSGHGSQVQLSVSDDGVGMSEQVQQHLFEPFFTTKNPGERGGMGLAAVYGIVAQSGGRTFVESEPGRGTVVRILFPAMPAPGPGTR
jgi:two-component system cell cycle sensor histidine kinase/response regulator CckA